MICWSLILSFAVHISLDPGVFGDGGFANLVKIDIAKNEVVTNETSTFGSGETTTLSATTASTLSITLATSTTVATPTTQKAVTSSQKPASTPSFPKTTTKTPPVTEIFEKPRSNKRAGLTNYFCKCDLTVSVRFLVQASFRYIFFRLIIVT
jgi:hypothetical protein